MIDTHKTLAISVKNVYTVNELNKIYLFTKAGYYLDKVSDKYIHISNK